MNDTYVVADLHLTEDDGGKVRAFLQLCDHLEGQRAARLAILGDLFHYWVNGESLIHHSHATVLNRLKALAEGGTEVRYFVGNRDFLFRSVKGLPENFRVHLKGSVLKFGDRHFYLTHGDDLCRRDWGYRLMKPVIRLRALERFFERLPMRIQQRVAAGLSKTSRHVVQRKSSRTLQVSLPHCWRLAERYRLDGIVHGHVHNNALTTLDVAGRSVALLSVGSWEGTRRPVWRYSDKCSAWREMPW